MGNFFTNLKIYCGYEFDRNQVVDQVNKVLYDNGFEVASEDQEADRTIIIKFSKQCPWVTIYDSFLESSSLDDLKSTVKDLSKALNKSVVGVSVFDSDVLAMYLNDVNLGSKDLVVCSDDDGFAEEIGYNPNTTKGKLTAWVPFLKFDKDKKKLKELFREKYTFAEDRLSNIAKILSMDNISLCSEEIDFTVCNDKDEDLQIISLVYREGYKPPFEIITKGRPVFSYCGKGYSADGIHSIKWSNTGGIGKGIRIIIEGDILKKYPFRFPGARIFKYKFYGPQNDLLDSKEYHKIVFKQCVDDRNNVYYKADLEDFLIPEGIKVNAKWGEKVPWKKIYDSIWDREICLFSKIEFSTDEIVEDELDITLIPYDNPVNGKCTVKKKIINGKLENWYGKYL